jgi:hypothetical protein
VKQFCKTILIISRFKQETIDKRACQRHAIKASEQIKSAKRKKKKRKENGNHDVNCIVQPKQFCTDLEPRTGKTDLPEFDLAKSNRRLSIEIRKLFRIDELAHRQHLTYIFSID